MLAGAGGERFGDDASAAAGEQDGSDYHFLSPDEFERRRQAGEFLECFEVFGRGYWYGTLESEVTPSLAAGKWVVLEIDVQGAMAVVDRYPDAITIFVHPSSLEELERRLRGRAPKPRSHPAAASKSPAASWPAQTAINTRCSTTTSSGPSRKFATSITGCSTHEEYERMLDELREEAIVNKVGGRFKLSTLIQKRLGGAQRRQPAAGRPEDRKQNGNRDPGNHPGQNLSGYVGQSKITGEEAGGGPRNSTCDVML